MALHLDGINFKNAQVTSTLSLLDGLLREGGNWIWELRWGISV